MESQSFLQKKHVQILLTLILVAVLAGVVAYTYYTLQLAQGAYTGEVTIQVTGEGELTAVPDLGTFSFAVRAEGDDAAAAQASATEAMTAIVEYLEEAGVAAVDIETDNYALNPQYMYEERICTGNGFCPPGERVLNGYEVFQNVTVKVRDLEEAGAYIAGVGERGATNISQLQFTIDDDANLMAQARAEAIADAKEKAKALADDLGMGLGKIVGFYENNGDMPMMYGYGGDMMEDRAITMESAPAAVLPTGENEVRSVVNITYQLR